jgi:hypothetical protein
VGAWAESEVGVLVAFGGMEVVGMGVDVVRREGFDGWDGGILCLL